MHALGGCARAIGADNVLLGAPRALRALAVDMLELYSETPAEEIARRHHRAKPHHESIVPMRIAALGLCCSA